MMYNGADEGGELRRLQFVHRTVVCALVASSVAAGVAFLVTDRPAHLVLALGAAASAFLLLPSAIDPRYDALVPLNLVAVTAILGFAGQAAYLALGPSSETSAILRGKPLSIVEPAAFVLTIGIMALVAGYHVRWPRLSLPRLSDDWNARRLAWIAGVLLIVAAVALVLYVAELRIPLVELIRQPSAKTARRLITGRATGGIPSGYASWLSSWTTYAFLLVWTSFCARRARWRSALGLAVVALGVLAAVSPFVRSARGELIVLLVYAVIVWHYLRRSLSVRSAGVLIAVALAAVGVLGGVRALSHERVGETSELFSGRRARQALVGGNEWMGLVKTALVMDAVPERMEFRHGSTLVSWVYAPVPRAIWPDKPVVRIGRELGPLVGFTGRGTGMPPGVVGELYLNFGRIGVVVGMLLFGMLLRGVYDLFRLLLPTNKSAIVIYCVVMTELALGLPRVDVSGTVISIVRSVIVLVIALLILSWRSERRSTTELELSHA